MQLFISIKCIPIKIFNLNDDLNFANGLIWRSNPMLNGNIREFQLNAHCRLNTMFSNDIETMSIETTGNCVRIYTTNLFVPSRNWIFESLW